MLHYLLTFFQSRAEIFIKKYLFWLANYYSWIIDWIKLRSVVFSLQTDTTDMIPTFSSPLDVQITSFCLYQGLFSEREKLVYTSSQIPFPSGLGGSICRLLLSVTSVNGKNWWRALLRSRWCSNFWKMPLKCFRQGVPVDLSWKYFTKVFSFFKCL